MAPKGIQSLVQVWVPLSQWWIKRAHNPLFGQSWSTILVYSGTFASRMAQQRIQRGTRSKAFSHFLINKSKIGLLLLSKELLLQLTQDINGISCTPIWYEAKLHIVNINLTAVDGTKYNFSNTWLGLAVLTHNNNVFLEHCLYFWSNLGWMVISSLEVLSISDDLVD